MIRILAVAAVILALPAIALAAPARTVELNASKTAAEWDGSGVTSVPFVPITTDDTLLKLGSRGNLTVSIGEFGPTGEEDLDIEIFNAGESGEPEGEPLVTGEETAPEETVQLKNVAVGNYLIRVYSFIGVDASYRGKVKLVPLGGDAPAPATGTGTGTAPAPAPTAPAPDQRPEAQITKLQKKAKAKAFKSFSGTASDDEGVKRVEVAIVLKKGKKCTQLKGRKFVKLAKCAAPSAFSPAKGTTAWSFKAPKLRRGSYTALARAVDSAGQVQAGYGPQNKKTFKLK